MTGHPTIDTIFVFIIIGGALILIFDPPPWR